MPQRQSAVEAAAFLLRHNWTSVPVVDDDGRLTGILSEKDLLPLMTGHARGQALVADLMSTQVVTFSEQTTASAVFDFLFRVAIRRVVVVRQGKPVGVISRSNLLRRFHDWASQTEPVETLI